MKALQPVRLPAALPACGVLCLLLVGCRLPAGAPPALTITEVPEAARGGAKRMERIAGRVAGALPGQRIVLFAKSGAWWVQPYASKPFTAMEKDGSWSSLIHLGAEYAALLVAPGYTPPRTAETLPAVGGHILAAAFVPGRPGTAAPDAGPRKLSFSGYEWDILQTPSESGGVLHTNRAANAWTDERGRLHLRIVREEEELTCAEISLTRSLGYGEYAFQIAPLPPLEPATVLGMFTWDPLEAGENHREIDIELSQWGDPAAKNAQFAIQPYYVPANVFRFRAPSRALLHSFRWEPGRVSLRTEGAAEHVFTSGVPSPGGERVHLNLYVYGKSRTPQQKGVEVVIEKFTYQP